jgi:SAM-dependent methyltransferase
MNNFNQYSQYYDLLYQDKNYKAESDYIIEVINTFQAKAKHILELGCGSGNHAYYLSEKYHITGIERSEMMVEEALKKNIKNFHPIIGDIKNFELNQKFDVAISLFHVISYLTDNESLINCFNTVNRHLNSKGIFMFDIWFTPTVYAQKPETRIKRLENEKISVLRIAESVSDDINNIINVNFELHIKNKSDNITTIINEIHPMRHFSIPEIALLAYQTGFEIIHTEEFLTKKQPSKDSWGICFVLRKK